MHWWGTTFIAKVSLYRMREGWGFHLKPIGIKIQVHGLWGAAVNNTGLNSLGADVGMYPDYWGEAKWNTAIYTTPEGRVALCVMDNSGYLNVLLQGPCFHIWVPHVHIFKRLRTFIKMALMVGCKSAVGQPLGGKGVCEEEQRVGVLCQSVASPRKLGHFCSQTPSRLPCTFIHT